MFGSDSELSCGARAFAIAAASLAAAVAVSAHTTVRSPAQEGVQADNALKIGHGCETPSGEDLPVIAQSVVFPTDAPVLGVSDPNAALSDLSEVIEQGGLAGLLAPIQDRSIFARQAPKQDALGNAIGFAARNGRLEPGLRGRVPFQFTAPNFVPSSCARRLVIEIAIADVCSVRRPTLEAGKVNLWVPDNGSHYAVAGAAAGIDGIGSPARLRVDRDLALNPLEAACGAGYDVTVTPSAAQVDRDLPIGRYWR